jgi:sugar transferase (PEP-CTERM/EpsH1 system associated)
MEELLFLAHRIPYPPNKGDKIRSYHMLRELARSYRVHLGAFVDDPDDRRYQGKLEALCESVFLADLHPLLARVRSLSGLLRGEALSVPYYFDRSMKAWVDNLLARSSLQRVLVFSSPMSQYVMDIQGRPTHRIIDFVDVDSDKWRQYAERKSWPASWVYSREGRQLLRYEKAVAGRFDASVFVSADEAALFQRQAPEVSAHVDFIVNGVDHEYFSPDRDYPDPYTGNMPVLVFTGAMDYWANIDAVSWFARDVFPRIREAVTNVQFFIVGARPTEEVLRLGAIPGVTVTGAVVDIRPYLAHARAAVAPLRVARGIQNKVLEAMAMAVPVLATPAAMEGIECNDQVGLRVSDNAQQFSDRAVQLLQQDSSQLMRASRKWVCQHHDWSINSKKMYELFESFPGQPENLTQT